MEFKVAMDHRHLRISRKRRGLYVPIVRGLLLEVDIYNDMNGHVDTLIYRALTLDTNERPFQCPQCKSTFGRLDTLLRHERTLHGSSTSAASNKAAHRSGSTHRATQLVLNRSNSTTDQFADAIQPLDPQLAKFRESPHHYINPSPPPIPDLSPIHHNPQSPTLILNGTNFSPPSSLLSNPSSSMVNPILPYPTHHKPHFSPLAESPALWDSFSTLEAMPPSASFGDIQSQFSRLLFNLLPSGPSVSPTPGPVAQTPAPLAATPNLDSFIHSPSPMSFPLSSERGLVIPTHSEQYPVQRIVAQVTHPEVRPRFLEV